MHRLAELQSRIRTLGELRDVVGAMRSLSAVHLQQAQETTTSIRQYTALIARALGESASRLPVEPRGEPLGGPATVVAFASEHGFVGAFNEHVIERAALHLEKSGDRLCVVGSRGAVIAAEGHHALAWTCPTASQIGAVADVARRVAEQIGRGESDDASKVVLVYARTAELHTPQVVVETLVPVDLAPYEGSGPPLRPEPLSHLGPGDLLDKLVEELVFAQLTRAVTESFASECAARLAAMTSAHDNIGDRLSVLERLERESRQEEIPTELLDIITGAEAIASNR